MMPKDVADHLGELEKEFGAKIVRDGAKKYLLKRTYAGEIPTKLKPMKRKQKEYLYVKQKGCCGRCRENFGISELSDDHFIARSHGGLNDFKNRRLLCRVCNSSKGANGPIEESKLGQGTVLEQIERMKIDENE